MVVVLHLLRVKRRLVYSMVRRRVLAHHWLHHVVLVLLRLHVVHHIILATVVRANGLLWHRLRVVQVRGHLHWVLEGMLAQVLLQLGGWRV